MFKSMIEVMISIESDRDKNFKYKFNTFVNT